MRLDPPKSLTFRSVSFPRGLTISIFEAKSMLETTCLARPESAHQTETLISRRTFDRIRMSVDSDPEKSHLWRAAVFQRFLNPLTICPAAAHRAPRNPSLTHPARSHHDSCKASPYLPETLTR